MRSSPLLAAALLLAFTACAKDKDKAPAGTAGSQSAGVTAQAPSGASEPSVSLSSDKTDKVSDRDGPLKPDGNPDVVLTLVETGPIRSILMLELNKDGKAESTGQWDTIVGEQPIPKAYGAAYEHGKEGWQLGVIEKGKVLNAADGTLTPIGDGAHTLDLHIENGGHFDGASRSFQVRIERPDGTIAKSNVFHGLP